MSCDDSGGSQAAKRDLSKHGVARRHDAISVPPDVEHAIYNSGLTDLVFLVVTSPTSDDEPAD